MRYLIIILTLASLLALMACRGSRELEIVPVGGPVATDDIREKGWDTVNDRTEPTGSTAADAMSRKDLGPDIAEKTESYSPDALTAHPASPDNGSHQRQRVEPTLKAGEVDDNKRWDEYLDFVDEYRGPPVHATNLSKRQIITVLDQEGRPVPNAKVTISMKANGEEATRTNRTYADGRTMFFPEEEYRRGIKMLGRKAQPEFTITADLDGFTGTLHIPQVAQWNNHEITLEGTMHYGENTPLDVLFLIDSTGSMTDEIHRIKSTLHSIARQIYDLPSSPDLRFGMVSYRDRGDEYVTQLYQFEGNAQQFSQNIEAVWAEAATTTRRASTRPSTRR